MKCVAFSCLASYEEDSWLRDSQKIVISCVLHIHLQWLWKKRKKETCHQQMHV